jgi:hypothetical protein
VSLDGFYPINSEMAAGAAHDGLFPRPLRRRVRGVPVPALVLNTILATALIPFDATGHSKDERAGAVLPRAEGRPGRSRLRDPRRLLRRAVWSSGAWGPSPVSIASST